MFKPKNKVGYQVLGLLVFTFAAFLLLNLMTLFSDEVQVVKADSGGYTCLDWEVCDSPFNIICGEPKWFPEVPVWVCICGYRKPGCMPCCYETPH